MTELSAVVPVTEPPVRDKHWKGPPRPVHAFAALNCCGQIIANSVRDSRDAVRLAAGECVPIRVTISYMAVTTPRAIE